MKRARSSSDIQLKSLALIDVSKPENHEKIELNVIAVHIAELKATKNPRIVDKLTLFLSKDKPVFDLQRVRQVSQFLHLQAKPVCLFHSPLIDDEIKDLHTELAQHGSVGDFVVGDLEEALNGAKMSKKSSTLSTPGQNSSTESKNLNSLRKISEQIIPFLNSLEVTRLSSQSSTCRFRPFAASSKQVEIPVRSVGDETLVFIDLEAAGLDEGYRVITEICIIAITKKDLLKRNASELPGECDKLVLVIDPKHSITATAEELTNLTQDTIMRSEKQPFNEKVVRVIEDYLNRHSRPMCFLAHGGHRFDFNVLRAHCRPFVETSSPIRECQCSDTLPAFRSLSWRRRRKERNGLDAIYQRCFPFDVRQDTHQAESDVVALMKVVRSQSSVFDLLDKSYFM